MRNLTRPLEFGVAPLAALLVLGLAVGACSGGGTNDDASTSAGDGDTSDSTDAEDSSSSPGDGDGDETTSGTPGDGDGGDGDGDPGDGDGDGGSSGDGDTGIDNPLTDPEDGPAAGWSEGQCAIPEDAGLEDVSSPTTVIGTGTPESCTGAAFITAVAQGGVITFDCGEAPHTITLSEPAKVFNDASPAIVIDGGGLVTLSGGGSTRILYMNTCDEAQHWTTSHCDNQDHPRLTVQNITFVDGSTADEPFEVMNDQGDMVQNMQASGGAIYAQGGRFKAVNTRFFNNACPDRGQDLGGGALRVFQQFEGRPAYLVNSTFGGAEGFGNTGSNGGAISSIGVSWSIYNSLFSHNSATGWGANPKQPDTPGGGSGGAIYNDGNTMTLTVCGSLLEENTVRTHGDAIFFVSNDYSGNVVITDSTIRDNCGGLGVWHPSQPGISNHEVTPVIVTNSTITGCEGP